MYGLLQKKLALNSNELSWKTKEQLRIWGLSLQRVLSVRGVRFDLRRGFAVWFESGRGLAGLCRGVLARLCRRGVLAGL